jgi:IstB-like ATP binding protein
MARARVHERSNSSKSCAGSSATNCSSSTKSGYLPRERQAANLLFALVSRRYERGSIIVTSNRSFEQWGEILGDAMVAAALIDRLVHHATMITLKGKSYRLRERTSTSRPPLRLRRSATPPDRRSHINPPAGALLSCANWRTFRLRLTDLDGVLWTSNGFSSPPLTERRLRGGAAAMSLPRPNSPSTSSQAGGSPAREAHRGDSTTSTEPIP